MKAFLKKEVWSPYLVGAFIGLLLTALLSIGYKIGVSTGISRVGALVEQVVSGSHIESTPYFAGLLSDYVIFNWKILFIVGMFLGAYASARLTPKKNEASNTLWTKAFGTSKARRNVAAFAGGFLLLFGARLANGCTSGHAISGGAQLAVTSWVFMMALFAVGIPTSLLMYRKNRGTS
ncbi:MAG: hypothetical protein S4CHLAM20_10230 [Chlamydiia bacterium]|nr:hypothetical protein [Chlamydiia bacterium]